MTLTFYRFVLIPLCAVFIYSCGTTETKKTNIEKDLDYLYQDLEFDMPRVTPPTFPDNSVAITDFGGVGDGVTVNTEAFSEAIDSLNAMGGGKLVIPEGIWLTGPIVLKSNINIHAENGALVKFTANYDDYPLVETSFEGLETVRCQSPISARGAKNIAFTGQGVFDGSGDFWRPVYKSEVSDPHWEENLASGRGYVDEENGIWYPSESYYKARQKSELNVVKEYSTMEEYQSIKEFLRPVMVSLIECENILLDGPTFQNSPAWCLHPLMSKNIIARNITVRNPWYSWNGDGIDIESCENVLLYNCRFDVGDDAMCVKSGKDEDGLERGMPTKNLVIKNCIVYHAHGGVVVGSEMSGGVKNLHASNCLFIGTEAGIRFKTTRGRGGLVEDIYISDINMTDILTYAITFNMYYKGLSPEKLIQQDRTAEEETAEIPEVTRETPQVRNISIKNIECNSAKQAIYLQGLPEMNLENVKLENINIHAEYGMAVVDAKNIKVKNLNLHTSELPIMRIRNSADVEIDEFKHNRDQETSLIDISGGRTGAVNFSNSGLTDESVNVSEEVEGENVTIN